MTTAAVTREMVAIILSLTVKVQNVGRSYIADSTVTACDKCSCKSKVKTKCMETGNESDTPPGIGFSFAMCHLPFS